MTMITGEILIGAEQVRTGDGFAAVDPSTGQMLAPTFSAAGAAEVERACALAWAAFDTYRETSLDARAGFLEAVAEAILAIGDPLIERAMQESGLPRARLEGERGRTVGQLRLFADVVRRGDFLGVRIDPALPDRTPLPRSDIRLRKIALGPVAVFGASNFPLAFSVAGGDTAAALAAGCPVVVKGHPAHPGTSELVGRAIRSAATSSGMPAGVFSLLSGPANASGSALVADPRIKAVGFTGSRAGGLALMEIAAARREPIPVYAEMSSINPVYLLPAALEERAEALATGFVGSLTLGSGQFCTNPGLVLALEGPALDRFAAAAVVALEQHTPAVMLTPGIHRAFDAGVAAASARPGVRVLARSQPAEGCNRGQAALFSVDAASFAKDEALSHEVFGAASLIVRCPDMETLIDLSERLEGQLTATLHLADADHALARRLVTVLERKAGRVLVNGWPTGVEVCHAMVHGGPYPASSDGRSTSVGSLAIERFLRPVCYQDLPDALLPASMQAANPLGLRRMVDGDPSQAP